MTTMKGIIPDLNAHEIRKALGNVSYGAPTGGTPYIKPNLITGQAIIETSSYTVTVKSLLWKFVGDSTEKGLLIAATEDYIPELAKIADKMQDLNAATTTYGPYQMKAVATIVAGAGVGSHVEGTYDASSREWTFSIDSAEYAADRLLMIEEKLITCDFDSDVYLPYLVHTTA